jgi:hypothetical protein
MNILKVLTKPETDNVFLVHWTNTTETQRGILRITVPSSIPDGKIVADLYALQYLLEIKEVIGNNSAGCETTKLFVTFGQIRKLTKKESEKQHLAEYAKFLTTRFKGCPIEVNKNEKWLTGDKSLPVIELDASKPIDETVVVHGFGAVLLTSHVVERFAERLCIENIAEAWRKLRRISAEPCVREIEKNNPHTRLKYAIKGREEGRYFLHPTQDLIFVVAKNVNGDDALVTVYAQCQN